MRTSNLNLATQQASFPVLLKVKNETGKMRRPRMIRIFVEDFNNYPISYATVKLTSGEFSTILKYDRETNSYMSRKFDSDRYDMEVTADFFETHNSNFYIPKSGIERRVCLAK